MTNSSSNIEFNKPFNDLTKFIPTALKNEMNVSLLDNLFNRFMTHDESVPFYGYVGKKPSSLDNKVPRIPQVSTEREVNAVTPVISFKTGATDHLFTVQDLIKIAKAQGVSEDGMGWFYSQANNFAPPINMDKFVNFYDYFWVAKTLENTPNLAWNPTLEPEYYVIAHPAPNDKNKMPVAVATTEAIVLTGSGFNKLDFHIDFLSPTEFTITPVGSLGAWAPTYTGTYTLTSNDQQFEYKVIKDGEYKTLVTFNIQRDTIYDQSGNAVGTTGFEANDKFILDVTFLTRNYNVSFSGSVGVKGKITKVVHLSQYQTIDGVVISPNDRVLVKNMSPAIDGIYIVSADAWQRAEDFNASTAAAEARVWVARGRTQASTMWQSFATGSGFGWRRDVSAHRANTNDWQDGNFWVSSAELSQMGYIREEAIQATRPIIEYHASMHMNSFVDVNGLPSDSGTEFIQSKTTFDQLPLFDLFRYDGTHANVVSSVFYYEENNIKILDVPLQKRLERTNNESRDFMFNHGMFDESTGQLLFVKLDDKITSVWHEGYLEPTIVNELYTDLAEFKVQDLKIVNEKTPQQVWAIEPIGDNTFSVIGTLHGRGPDATANIAYDNGEISFTIDSTAAITEFDTFYKVQIGNLYHPEYVYVDENGNERLFFGGTEHDKDGIGAYRVSDAFIKNPYSEVRSSMTEGVVNNHFRSIMNQQVEGLPTNLALGGDIKLWGEQQTLMAAILMQRDLTATSIIDLAESMYGGSLNSIKDIYKQNAVALFSKHGAVQSYEDIEKMLDTLLEINATGELARSVLFDTTSPVKGFPATLPQLAGAELVAPSITYNPELGIQVLIHHDGHMSELAENTVDFQREVFGRQAKHPDLNSAQQIITPTPTAPANPYKGEMWRTMDGQIFVFTVDSDATNTPANPNVGFKWYDRSSKILFVWDGASWVADSASSAWLPVNLANTLNLIILALENRLYKGINPHSRKVDFVALENDPEFVKCLKDELYTFAALNGYDPTGTNYQPSDAFTWNYSKLALVNSAPVHDSEVPARWFDYLMSHQRTVSGVIPTAQPHVEPWKLLGWDDSEAWWNSLSEAKREQYTPAFQRDQMQYLIDGGLVKAVSSERISHPMVGLITVDGVALQSGDRFIIANDIAEANNGVWIASTAGWTRDSSVTQAGTMFRVQRGSEWSDTVWALRTNAATSNMLFGEVRVWTNALWADIKAARPTLKLSVNTRFDTLLPPYVKPGTEGHADSLTNVIPPGAASEYSFGQNSPVESIWKHTAEYLYSRVRALFRYDPLMFFGLTWGINWENVNGVSYDAFSIDMPGAHRFRLHGDIIPLIGDRPDYKVGELTTPLIVTYTAFNENKQQEFTITDTAGNVLGYCQEGVAITAGELAGLTINDYGIAFRIGDRFEFDTTGTGIFVPIAYNKMLGFCQIFANALRQSSIDTKSSYAVAAFREWDVHMGYRAGGLVSTDDLQVITDQITLPKSAYALKLKRNPMAFDTWAQSFRISVQRFGASVIDSDTGTHVPANEGEDWVFRIEGFNPRYTKVKIFDFDPSSEVVTFHALGGETTDLPWYRPTKHLTGAPRTVQLPLVITGIQNVVNFLFGYLDAAEADGWVFNKGDTNSIDAATGRTRTMQLEVEKYINDVYRGYGQGQASIINPFIDTVWFEQKHGLMAEFVDTSLFDVAGQPGIFDMLGVRYKAADLNIIRRNHISSIAANGPIFSVHAQVDDYEHLFIFSNFAQSSNKSGMLYDAFSGSRVSTYRFNGKKQETKTMRPEYGGHYLVGDSVRQGLQASTDNVQQFYDANHVFENEETTRNALALLGFNRKGYFDDLDISAKSQFNFWRGLIHAKGTNMSIDAYLNNDRFDDARVDESWAYKVAEYGDSRSRFYPELKVNVDDALTQFTQLWFDPSSKDLEDVPVDLRSFSRVTRYDEDRWFSIDDLDHDAYFEAMQVGSYVNTAKVGDIINLPFIADNLVASGASKFSVINATTIKVDAVNADGKFSVVGYGAATPKFNPVKLFNYVENTLVAEIPFWHPAAGAHAPQPIGSVNIISSYNPARFNTSTVVAESSTFDPLRVWGKNEIGRTWLDTSNLHYVPYYDKHIFKTLGERLSRWGTLADYGSVDVFEWVESTVPPSEYDALARAQAGDANLDSSTKAGGEVGFPSYYVRNRTWQMRPIAWHFSPVPLDIDFEGTPPFPGGSSKVGLRFDSNGLAILDASTFAAIGIKANMHIGAWDNDPVNPKPLNEYALTSVFTKFICDSSGVFLGCDKLSGSDQGLNLNTCVLSNDAAYNPDLTGQIIFQALKPVVTPTATDATGKVIARTIDLSLKATNIGTGISETITVASVVGVTDRGPIYGAQIEVAPDQQWTFEFRRLGLTVTSKATTQGMFPADALANAIAKALGASVWVRDAVIVNPIIAAAADASYLTNDPDQAALLGAYGWRAWNIPSQSDLSNDGQWPVSSWKPYYGDFESVPNFSNQQLQEALSYVENPLTLNNGTTVNRYSSVWTEWEQLRDTMHHITQVDNAGPVTFTYAENVPTDRVSVYLNGAQLLVSSYNIDGKNVTVNSVEKGHTATVVVRHYQPTAEDLAFNPDETVDWKRQRHYKLDFEYVVHPVRGQDGGIDSHLYYFWVRNKTTAAVGKRMSIQAVTTDLTRGPANYLTFQHILPAEKTLPYRYDAITIAGLSNIVTKDNTFKLRFTRDFTLRDDPQELDLKNVHTEWTLIRPGQRMKIPEALWQKLTDSVSGEDIAGNQIPSLRRVLYDERHNTRTRFGFSDEQTLGPAELLKTSLIHSIINTKLVDTGGLKPFAEEIEGLDYDAEDQWFIDAQASRKTMTDIWNNAEPEKINEIFFGALEDILASNYELTDLFKTSRLSAYSIKVVTSPTSQS